MKSITLSALLAALSALPLAAVSPAALAGPDDGVRCPTGYTSSYGDSSHILRCSKNTTQTAATACLDPLFTVYWNRNGADRCLPTGSVIPVVGDVSGGTNFRTPSCVHAPGQSGWSIVHDGGQGNRDNCRRTFTDYVYPTQL
jgi:hypothetical protein